MNFRAQQIGKPHLKDYVPRPLAQTPAASLHSERFIDLMGVARRLDSSV
jgi:hypothetical protein